MLVEAFEELFVPLAIRNNEGGEAARWLKHYEEPAWNNPVVRFFASDGKELVARKQGVWSFEALVPRMIAALKNGGSTVPTWLDLLGEELGGERETAVFAMACFWEGEARLGALDGVVGTRPAFFDGHEVVEVRFDPARVEYGTLVRTADSLACAGRVYAQDARQLATARGLVGERAQLADGRPRDAGRSDSMKRLTPTAYAVLPLTPLQRIRVNAALGTGGDPARFLSPRQRGLLERVQAAWPEKAERLRGLGGPGAIGTLDEYEARLVAALE